MRKRMLLFTVVLFLMIFAFAGTVTAADLPETCPRCGENVTWEALDATAADVTELAEGHYYLAFEEDSAVWTKKTISEKVCIHLNGKTVQAKDDRVFDVSGNLSLIGEGSILGRAFTSNYAGGAIYVSGVLNVDGPTVATTAEEGRYATYGGVVYVTGTMNMYSGMVTGGNATKNGGTVAVYESGKLAVYGGTISKGKAGNVGGTLYTDTNACLESCGGNIYNGSASVSDCIFAKSVVTLSGDGYITQLRMASLVPEKLIVKGVYTGRAQLCFLSSDYLYFMDGDVIGTCDDADLTGAKLSVYGRSCYVKADGDDLKISFAKPVAHKTAYCVACRKDVEWVALTEMDNASGDMETGHYFLDFTGDSLEFGTKNVKGYNRICLDLNGKCWDSTDRAFRIYSGILNVMDSVGGGTIIGRGTTDNSITGGTIRVQADAEFNLYSGNLTYKDVADDGRGVVVRGGVVYVAGGVFNMYGGKIYGGAARYGANVAVWNDGTSYGSLNIYGGEIGENTANTGGLSTKGTGIYSICYVTLSGNPTISNLYLAEDGAATFDRMLTIDGTFSGKVVMTFPKWYSCLAIGYGNNADYSAADISVTNSVNIKMSSYGSKLFLSTGNAYLIENEGKLTAHKSLQAAIDAYTAGKIALMADATTAVTVDKDILIDLNGHSISGEITGDYTVSCMDSVTDDYTVADGVYGKVLSDAANVKAADGYLEVLTDGARSYHRLDLEIRQVSLRTAKAGLYYRCDFAGDEMVKDLVTSFGIALNTKEEPNAANMETTSLYTSFNQSAFNTDAGNSVLLSDIFKTGNTDKVNKGNASERIYGRAYVVMGEEYVFGQSVSCSLRQVLTAVNTNWSNLTVKQKIGLMEMYGRFPIVMEPYSSSFKSAYDTIQTRNAKDYSAFMCPWTENVVDAAVEDGKLHYYFMAGEGGVFSNGSYNEKWGDSYLLVFPNGETMLIDTGYSSYGPMLTQNLKRMGVEKIDHLVITHPHSDHQGGSFYEYSVLNTKYGLLHSFEIGQVYYRGGYDPEEVITATMVSRICSQLDLPLQVLEKGNSLNIGGVRLDVIWPLAGEGDTIVSSGVEINDKSVVFRVEYGEHTSLLTGDLY
ncbi:MAG: MBL fold metallo-hydrolase, partial [Oscillospiraceae bacterium]|nr:MBL fold metallo-hydrolase [Oscillospiraceae bacterium]